MTNNKSEHVSKWDSLADRYSSLQHERSLLFAHWLTVGYIPALTKLKELSGGSLSQQEILDYGCGSGSVTEIYRLFYNASIKGCDIASAMIEIAQTRYPNGTFLCIQPNDTLPFANSSFSGIVSNWVIPAIASIDKLKSYFATSYRLLKNGCHIVLLFNNPSSTGIRSFSYTNGESRQYRPGEPIDVKFFDNDQTRIPCMEFSDFYWDLKTIETMLALCGFVEITTTPKLYRSPAVATELAYLRRHNVLNPNFDCAKYLSGDENDDSVLVTHARKP